MTKQINDLSKNEIYTPGARLKAARGNMGLTRKKLAELTGIPEKSIEKYEYGTMDLSISRLKAICAILEIEPNEIVEISTGINKRKITEGDSDADKSEKKGSEKNEKYFSECNVHLNALDEMRKIGFNQSPRKAEAHHNALTSMLCFLEYNELQELAALRDIKTEKENPEVTGNDERYDFFQDEQDTSEPDCQELENRIIDTAIFGVDIYSIKLVALSNMAEDHDLSPDRFIWAGWRDHKEIVDQIRKAFLKKTLLGNLEVKFYDIEKFPRI